MENVHNAADHPAAQAVHEPAEGSPGDVPAAIDAAEGADLAQLGIDGGHANTPTPLSPKAKLTAWALGVAGLLALCTLVVGAVMILEWMTPYLRYLYFIWLGSGGGEL